MAAKASHGMSGALGGIMVAGILLAIVGLVVHLAGSKWIDIVMPPVVTGSIVALIGLNLAPAARSNFEKAPLTAFITLAAVILITVLFRGIAGRLAILLGVVVYVIASDSPSIDRQAVGITVIACALAWVNTQVVLGLSRKHQPTLEV